MKKVVQWICSVALAFFLAAPGLAPAQTDSEWLAALTEEEQEAINALVLYPEETRLAILETAKHPEALIKMESIQTKSQTAFRTLVEKYPQHTQEMLWDLTRYPGLIERLVAVSDGAPDDLNRVLAEYPAVIHDRAKEAVRFYGADLAAIAQLEREAHSAFETLLADYPTEVRNALRHLLDLPEALAILTDNFKLTVLVGDLYRNDPDRVWRQADSLNLVAARQQAQELADWKESLENDPEARAELEASAEAFGEEHGYLYDDAYYDPGYDEIYYEEEESPEVLVSTYHYYHYPYWFAYPYWYTFPRWREYPYWYDWGFYYGPRRTVVVVSLPSFYFVNWYFYHPYHHYRWSYLSAHFTRHYYGHRKHGGSITAGVTVWQNRNRNVVSNEWLRDDGRLPARFREFGKFEADRAKYNRSHPQRELDQQEFRDRNPDRYRTLANPPRERTGTAQPGQESARIPADAPRPTVREPRTDRRVLIPRRRTESEPAPRPQTETPRSDTPSVRKATERHRSISERNKTDNTTKSEPTTPRTKAPRGVTSKPRTTTTKKATPRKKGNN